jgi:AcrR family transcriptional regulator
VCEKLQVPKDNIEERILIEALKEFDGKGFSRASLRRIASGAGVSTSNIYNYFANKDALFLKIVEPVIESVEKYFNHIEFEREYLNTEKWSFESHLKRLELLADFIDVNRKLLKLVAFKAHGSSLEDYKELLIKRYTRTTLHFMKESARFYPGLKADASEFFVHNLASFWMNIILEIIMHDIPRKDMMKFLKEIMTFMFYGYEGLCEYDFSKMCHKPHS